MIKSAATRTNFRARVDTELLAVTRKMKSVVDLKGAPMVAPVVRAKVILPVVG